MFTIPTILFFSAFGSPKTKIKMCPTKRKLDNPISTNPKRQLLEVNQQDENGNTLLHRIVLSYYSTEKTPQVIQEIANLIHGGADLLLRNNEDQNFLDIVIDQLKTHTEDVEYIKIYKYRIEKLSDLLRIEIPESIARVLHDLNKNTDDIDQLCNNLKNLFSGDLDTEQLSINLNDLNI